MKVLHLICNAHLDPVYQWRLEEGMAQSLSTFWSACNLAEEFDYIFCHNEALLYEYIEKNDAILFETIKKLVEKGKWKIIGGWYLQPDCNMLSGESVIKQIQYGKKYFTEKFGTWSKIAINFDSFGHSRGLVQIIKKNGQDGYLFTRPQQWQKDLPCEEFIWVGYDGSSVKAIRAGDCYGTDLGKVLDRVNDRINQYDKLTSDKGICLWGVGNHGGGPSRKDLLDIKNFQSDDWKIIHSTPEEYFELSNPTAEFKESLILCMPGCYTSMSLLKQRHIKLENLISLLNSINVYSSFKPGIDFDDEQICEIDKCLMLSEFHDILPGSAIKDGINQGIAILDSGIYRAEELINKYFVNVIKAEDKAKENEIPFFIFNPYPYEISGDFELEFMLPSQNWQGIKGCDVFFSGKKILVQQLKEESNINLDWRKRIVVNCTLKPFDINRLTVIINDDGKKFEPYVPNKDIKIDNKFFSVVISKDTGKIISFNKDNTEYIKDNSFGLYMFDDNADPWGMGIKQMECMGENTVPFEVFDNYDEFIGDSNVRVIEDGELLIRIESFFRLNNTTARIEYTISKSLPLLDIKVDLFVGDKEKMIKLKVPVNLTGSFIGEQTFGTERLYDDGKECVSHRFVAISDENENCFAILNNCIYGASYKDNNVYLSLLRNTSYCTHPIPNRDLNPHNRSIKYAEFGERNFNFRFSLCQKKELSRLAKEFNQPPLSINYFPSGKYEKNISDFKFSLNNKNIIVSNIKKSLEKQGYILRLFNNYDKQQTTLLKILGIEREIYFLPYEVKTFVFHDDFIREEEEMYI